MSESHKSQDQKRSFLIGVITGVVVLGLLGGVFLLGRSSGGGGNGGGGIAGGNVPVPTQPTAPAPREGDVTKIAKVSKDDHIRGDSNAKVTLIEYSDFECPFCARFSPTVEQVLAEYDGQVRLIYRHFPLRSIHPVAQKAAEASECAADQGKFWEMHDALFALNTAGSLSLPSLKSTAADLGLNTSDFDSCLDSGDKAADVEEDYQDGIAGGVSGTPGTFVDDQYLAGALPFEQVRGIIEAKL
jgi:protein-disulfide isomerase